MQITIKYFGQIVEVTHKTEETLEVSGNQIADVLNTLQTKYIKLKDLGFQIAQNQELVSLNTKISGAEIALLPPFAGG
ncbi:MoaD/ThiS family protein [Neotamlana laminarinivorans]|uniref:MoaD/ThiS family protein n=1 Tax=Neotamlana laminarinivorans TaxID=2883124 RepID=A0A9X1HYH7_9FLAO|nr:MoaD/ThiS family protein [Tamlana laminarinivorans]MCB4798106.1 MoaD/ThiS family protein [Tamlana laminarinivorans]